MWKSTLHRDALIRAAKHNMLHASYCFFGDEGVGRRTTAQEIAAYLETGSFSGGALIDVRSFVPNEKGTIGIDEVRELKEFCSKAPFRSSRRTAIIESGECMTDQAQSALLKLFEEPNEHTLVFVIVRNKDVLFAPLLSRMHALYFPRFSKKQVVDFLVQEDHIPGSVAETIAQQSFGSLGRARLLAQKEILNGVDESVERYIENSIERYYKKDPIRFSHIIAQLLKKEVEIKSLTLNGPLQKRFIQSIESKV